MSKTRRSALLPRLAATAAFLGFLATACSDAVEPNLPPRVDAGPDFAVDEGATAVLEGAADDPDGSVVGFTWIQSDGPPVSLASPGRSTTEFLAPGTLVPLTLRFTLTVLDDRGAVGRDSVAVTVRPVNLPPVVFVGADQEVDEQTLVQLFGTAHDDDGDIVERVWAQVEGDAVELTGANRDSVTFIAPVTTTVLTLRFAFRATDNEGGSSADTVAVRVRPVNQPPAAAAGDDQVVPEQTLVRLVGAADDEDGEIVEVAWTQVAGVAVDLVGADRDTASFTAPVTVTALELRFEFRVTDNEGGSAADTVSVEVEPVNALPTATAGEDQIVPEATSVRLVGGGADEDGEIVEVGWTQVAGAAVGLQGADRDTASFLAPVTTTPLTLRFEFRVTDNEGGSAADTVAVQVQPVNEPPIVVAGQDQLVTEGTTVRLSGSATDEDGSIASVAWVQVGGLPVDVGGAGTLEATFVAPPTVLPRALSFRLTAVDNEGASASDDVRVDVRARVDAGFHFSLYSSTDPNVSPDHWVAVARRIAGAFWQGSPAGLWTVAHVFGRRPLLSFPGTSSDPYIDFSAQDRNEAALARFDETGVGVWLLVEPGDASVEELIRLVLGRYGDHPSVRGVGVDVEWFRSFTFREGKPVSDGEARSWRDVVRSFDPDYGLVLIHWEMSKMPPSLREGLIFLDDSQGFRSSSAMLAEFGSWGAYFTPARVAFLYGFPSDEAWWSALQDPPVEIGGRILDRVPNTVGLFWIQ